MIEERTCPHCGGEIYTPEDTRIPECAWCNDYYPWPNDDPAQLLLGGHDAASYHNED